ncbi:hypothetical protein RhiirA1_416234 [Rhizophagus irregularis]|uniref:C2H2-type domain-containing protein n=1 Tax=Rhizophagus irregularis TaxID=588596 RepID=A0A2N0S0D6_9GLOM|nr:hypothetical protein RhiirA1_416234 [Rhizophagus irregularis]
MIAVSFKNLSTLYIRNQQKPINCTINGCTKSFTRHGHLSRHVQSCQSKRNRKENEKPVHPLSPVTSCIN